MFGPSILFNVSKLLNDCHVMEHFLRGSPLFPGLCISSRAGASQIVQQRSEIFLEGRRIGWKALGGGGYFAGVESF